jgi:hypothetical protein
MKDRILVYEERGQKAQFLKAVTSVKDAANKLIQDYNSYQSWDLINTLNDFEELYSDPLGMFDKTLLQNIDISAKGNKKPDPVVLSSLFGIDRPGYMAVIGQTESVKDADCPDCAKKTQTVKVNRIKTNAEFYQYAEFLLFIDGLFQLNNKAISEYCDRFNIYADSPEQISLYNHWQSVCDILNKHDKQYVLSVSGKQQIASALKLQLSEATSGRFIVDNMRISETIKYMK